MKKFKVAIEEAVVAEFEVQAKNADEAMEIAEQKYKAGEFVLEPGDVQFKQMAVVAPESEATEWKEF